MQMHQYPWSPLFLAHSNLEHKDQPSFYPKRLLKDVKKKETKMWRQTHQQTQNRIETPDKTPHVSDQVIQGSTNLQRRVKRSVIKTSGNFEKHGLPKEYCITPEELGGKSFPLGTHILEVYLLPRNGGFRRDVLQPACPAAPCDDPHCAKSLVPFFSYAQAHLTSLGWFIRKIDS